MKTLTLINKGIGKNEYWEVRNELSKFVKENFNILYAGACRLPYKTAQSISDDYYTCRRIQINRTRLHRSIGLKYADGHKYCSDYAPTEENLAAAAKDIQTLLDAAGENILCSLQIKITPTQEEK